MKKIILGIIMILTVFTLASCDLVEVTEEPVNCAPGYEEIDGACEEIDYSLFCEDDEEYVNDECVVIDDTVYTNDGPDYNPQGYDIYEGRDLVADSCSHLDNVGEWQPVWCDEFNYTGLPDSTLWGYDVGGSGWGNNELQYYTNADADNAYVSDGVLTIAAIKEYYSGNEYTSARLISKNTGDWLYGKIEIRAQLPTGVGTWPAAWMLPTDWEYGGWPDSGEIDIMEYVGYQPNVLHATIHTLAYNHSIGTQVGKTRTLPNAETTFNVFEIEWEPNIIRYYLNGDLFFTVDYDPVDAVNVDPYKAWPFDKDFHLILNLAIGGNWGGALGVASDLEEAYYYIDYVRVYQKDYAGMDNEAPLAVTDLSVLDSSQNQAFVAWDVAVDDIMTKEYEVYLDDVLLEVVSHNAALLSNLSSETTYNIKVIPVDFAGNKGIATELSFTTGAPLTIASRVEAEDYSQMYGIQIEGTSDAGGGDNVGYIDNGDYMYYELVVTESGTYTVTSRVASQAGGGSFDFYQDDVKLFSQAVPVTGGWQTWQSVTSTSFTLTPGTYLFKVISTGQGYNINYFEFNKIG